MQHYGVVLPAYCFRTFFCHFLFLSGCIRSNELQLTQGAELQVHTFFYAAEMLLQNIKLYATILLKTMRCLHYGYFIWHSSITKCIWHLISLEYFLIHYRVARQPPTLFWDSSFVHLLMSAKISYCTTFTFLSLHLVDSYIYTHIHEFQ